MNSIYTLDSFLNQVSQYQKYKILLGKASQNYQISNFNLTKMTIKQIKHIRKRLVFNIKDDPISQKQHINKIKNDWSNNELKLFVWVIVCYVQLTQRHLRDLTQEDWIFLAAVVPTKSIQILKYESLKLYKENSLREKWTKDQDDLLMSILKQQKLEGQWNEVSRLFYFKSQKKFFKNPRKCRQRWFNHLNLFINRNKWTTEEDLILFQKLLAVGCKWALVSKSLNGSRTENMIKNRYKSVINKLQKTYASLSENQLLQKKIQLIKKQIKKASEKDNNNQKMEIQTVKVPTTEQQENWFDELKNQNSKDLDFNLSYFNTGTNSFNAQLSIEEQMIQIDSSYKQLKKEEVNDYLRDEFYQAQPNLFGLLP